MEPYREKKKNYILKLFFVTWTIWKQTLLDVSLHTVADLHFFILML